MSAGMHEVRHDYIFEKVLRPAANPEREDEKFNVPKAANEATLPPLGKDDCWVGASDVTTR